MQSENRLLDDLAKIAGGAFSSFSTLKDEAEARLHEKLEKILVRMDLVKRDEFEAVQAMAIRARKENDALGTQLEELKAQLREQLTGTATKNRLKQQKQRATLKVKPSPKDD
tara:strand:+ start:28 stop:363 length:336 start_codon:yes stop_codon:yes gene_type:complete